MYRSRFSLLPAVRRAGAALACALMLGGCSTWAEAPNPSPYSTRVIRGPLRIVRTDGFSVVAEDVSVRNDSVVGHEAGRDDRLIAVALADVKRTEAQSVDPLASIGVALVGVAAGFGAFVYLALTHMD